jgi:hypothetical protein
LEPADYFAELTGNHHAAAALRALAEDKTYGQLGDNSFYAAALAGKVPEVPLGAYRRTYRQCVEASGVIGLLTGSQESQPDIYGASIWMQLAAPLLRPRNTKQMVEHLCCFLDWYLNPGKPIGAWRTFAALSMTDQGRFASFGAGLVAMLLFYWFIGHVSPILFVPQVFNVVSLLNTKSLSHWAGAGNYRFHSEELYLCLVRSFSEPAEDVAAAIGLQSAELPQSPFAFDPELSKRARELV